MGSEPLIDITGHSRKLNGSIWELGSRFPVPPEISFPVGFVPVVGIIPLVRPRPRPRSLPLPGPPEMDILSS